MMRLAIVATHPIQYQVPLWAALAADPALEVHVFFASDGGLRGYKDPGFGIKVQWDVPLDRGYPFSVLAPGTAPNTVGGLPCAARLRQQLKHWRPDAVLITGYAGRFWPAAVLAIRSLRLPLLIRSEATDVAVRRSARRAWLRRRYLTALYAQCAKLLVIGSHARRHYMSHGVPPERLDWSPYCVDTSLIDQQVRRYSPQRAAIRAELGATESDTVFVFSGKLIPQKDPTLIARALERLPAEHRRRTLLLVMGDGLLRPEVESACREQLGGRLVMLGFVNQSSVGRYYAAGDWLLLPSAFGETWGLVVNEALQFGLGAIVSDRVGCAPDLIEDGRTGWVFPAGDHQALADRMLRVLECGSGSRAERAHRCRKQVERYTVQVAADGIRRAALSTQRSPG